MPDETTAVVVGGGRAASGVYDDFHAAYVAELGRVFDEPHYFNAPRGHRSRERIGAHFVIADARQRVPFVAARRLNIVFNFAEALWYLSGRDDVDFVAYYAPSIRRYSMDGRTLRGTAYGRALFALDGRIDQWKSVVDVLAADPDSKRAVVQMFRAEELLVPDNIDVSCTLGLQFLLRDGTLHAVGYMRANDAYRGVVSDVFSFTFLQEVLATQIGAEVGSYVHNVGSIHVYEPDDERVRAVLDDATGPAPYRFPVMPVCDNRPYVRTVLEHEEALRAGDARLDAGAVAGLDLPHYWRQVVLLLELYRELRHDGRADERTLDALDPIYRYFVAHRWPRGTL